MKTIASLTVVACAAFVGCAVHPPAELLHARLTYQRAQGGQVEQLAPAELHKAREALKQAEASFAKDGDGYRTRDLAYVATRKTQMARALAAIANQKGSRAASNKAFQETQTRIVTKTKRELSNTRKNLVRSEIGGARTRKDLAASEVSGAQARRELASSEKSGARTRRELASSEKRGERTAVQLSAERAARISAEKLAADALATLSKLAEVRKEERGLVITLSGSVLFASNKAALLPVAQARVNQVAQALLATRERNLIVEGHTDSRGTKAYNLDLSQRRADSVREYLMGRGYAAARIVAQGIGEGRPIANNATAEGRANNRRVEIIIQRLAMRH